MDEFQRHDVEQKKSDTKKYIFCIFPLITSKQTKFICTSKNQNSQVLVD